MDFSVGLYDYLQGSLDLSEQIHLYDWIVAILTYKTMFLLIFTTNLVSFVLVTHTSSVPLKRNKKKSYGLSFVSLNDCLCRIGDGTLLKLKLSPALITAQTS